MNEPQPQFTSRDRRTLRLTELAGNLDDLSRIDVIYDEPNPDLSKLNLPFVPKNRSIIKSIAYYMNMSNPIEWIFLLFFPLVLTSILFVFDIFLYYGLKFRLEFCSNDNHPMMNLIMWVTSSVILVLISTSVGYFISPDADGSGIPEVKTVISGIDIYRYFSIEAFVGKMIGLYTALVGGASIGKVGPFVHISAIVCSRLLKIKLFSKLNNSTSTKNAMMACASAAGVTLALGTPISGVIFSMEVTSSIYIVGNIAKAFTCATMCVIYSRIFSVTNKNMKLFTTPEQIKPLDSHFDLVFFILLGVICGLIGGLLSTIVSKLIYIRRKSKLKLLSNRFYFAIATAIVISLISFNIKPLMIFDRYMLTDIFNINFPENLKELNHPNEGVLLLILFCFKILVTMLSVSINMPTGIFAPFFLIGAYYGRLYGHILKFFFNVSEESIYAMVGAACVMSGATHSVSSAIIIFELTGQSSYLLPMLLACLLANITAQAISISFFDVMLLMKNLPHLPSIKSSAIYKLTAENITSKGVFPIVISDFRYFIALEILFNLPKNYRATIPLIDDQGVVKYTVQPRKLLKYLMRVYEAYKFNYEIETQRNIQKVIEFVRCKLGKKYSSFWDYLKHKCRKICMTRKAKEEIQKKKLEHIAHMKGIFLNLKSYSMIDNLILNSKIDSEDPLLKADRSALTVDKSYPCLKLQFLFTFLNVSAVFVNENGSLYGVITKEDFVKRSMLLN